MDQTDRYRRVGQRESLRAALGVAHRVSGTPSEETGEPQHHRRGIDPNDRRTQPGCTAGGGTWPASDVSRRVARSEFAEALGQAGVTLSVQHHAGSGEESGQPGEARVMGVVIWDG